MRFNFPWFYYQKKGRGREGGRKEYGRKEGWDRAGERQGEDE